MTTGSSSRNVAESLNYDFIYTTYPEGELNSLTYGRLVNLVGERALFNTALLIVPNENDLSLPPSLSNFQKNACLLLPAIDLEGDSIVPIFKNFENERFYNNIPNATYKTSPGSTILWSIDQVPELSFAGVHLFDNPYYFTNVTDLQGPLLPNGTNANRIKFQNIDRWIVFNINYSSDSTDYNQDWLNSFHSKYFRKLLKSSRFRYRSAYSLTDLTNQLNIGAGGATTLNELTDVTIAAPVAGEVLTYVGPNWENRPSSIRRTVEGAPYSLVTAAGVGEFDFLDAVMATTRVVADIRNVTINKTSLAGAVENWIIAFPAGFSQVLKFRVIDEAGVDALFEAKITGSADIGTRIQYGLNEGLVNQGTTAPVNLVETSNWLIEHPFSDLFGTAFTDLTDVAPLVPAAGQVVYYDSSVSRFQQAGELVVDPVTKDVISTTTGLFSQVSTGSASIGSIGAEANVQGQTGVNVAAVTGTVLVQGQNGGVDIDSSDVVAITGTNGITATSAAGPINVSTGDTLSMNGDNGVTVTSEAGIDITNDLTATPITIASLSNEIICQGQTKATLQSLAGNVEVKSVASNVNVIADLNVNLTATTGDVVTNSLAGNVTSTSQLDTTITSTTGTASLIGTNGAFVTSTNASVLVNAADIISLSGLDGVDIVSAAGPVTADGTLMTLTSGGAITITNVSGDIVETANAFLTLTSSTEQVRIRAPLDEILMQSAGQTLQNSAGTLNRLTVTDTQIFTSIPSYEASMISNSLATKQYVDDSVVAVAGYPLKTDQDKYSFKIRSTGNSPASGEIMYLDNSDVNQFGTFSSATKVRFSKNDANGLVDLGGFIADTVYNWILLPQEGSTLAFLSIKYTSSSPVDGGTYWEYPLNYQTDLGTFTDDQACFFIRNTVIEPEIANRLENPQYFSAFDSGANSVTVVSVGNAVAFAGTNFVDDSNVFSYAAGVWTCDDPDVAALRYRATLSVSGYADVQDTRCEFYLAKNGSLISGSSVISYAKNSITESEGTNSRTFILEAQNGDVFDIRAAFIEDNSPAANPTTVTMENFSLVVTQIKQ